MFQSLIFNANLWASSGQNRSLGFPTKQDSNQSPLEIFTNIILSTEPIIKALISLRGYAGWSAPLLFANPKDRFSHVEAIHTYFKAIRKNKILTKMDLKFYMAFECEKPFCLFDA